MVRILKVHFYFSLLPTTKGSSNRVAIFIMFEEMIAYGEEVLVEESFSFAD